MSELHLELHKIMLIIIILLIDCLFHDRWSDFEFDLVGADQPTLSGVKRMMLSHCNLSLRRKHLLKVLDFSIRFMFEFTYLSMRQFFSICL